MIDRMKAIQCHLRSDWMLSVPKILLIWCQEMRLDVTLLFNSIEMINEARSDVIMTTCSHMTAYRSLYAL